MASLFSCIFISGLGSTLTRVFSRALSSAVGVRFVARPVVEEEIIAGVQTPGRILFKYLVVDDPGDRQ